MMSPDLRRARAALLPWIGALGVWLVLIQPMRATQATRREEQGRIRRYRLKVSRGERETQGLRSRIGAALGNACRASADPAVLRQRMVSATAGLSLSPFALSVSGGPGGGASVEAQGTRSAVLTLTSRLGDAAKGSFLRSVLVRDLGPRWGVTLSTGVLDSFPPGGLGTPAVCSVESGPMIDAPPTPPPTPVQPPKPPPAMARHSPLPGPATTLSPFLSEPTLPPPFTLIGFLSSGKTLRVSVRAGEEVRVVSAGDQVMGWTCVSIDRDEGAVFISASGARVTLGVIR